MCFPTTHQKLATSMLWTHRRNFQASPSICTSTELSGRINTPYLTVFFKVASQLWLLHINRVCCKKKLNLACLYRFMYCREKIKIPITKSNHSHFFLGGSDFLGRRMCMCIYIYIYIKCHHIYSLFVCFSSSPRLSRYPIPPPAFAELDAAKVTVEMCLALTRNTRW